jgi:hypothetical protein
MTSAGTGTKFQHEVTDWGINKSIVKGEIMLRIKNPFKNRENKKRVKGFSIGELAWKSVNLENEQKNNPKLEAGSASEEAA